jgi:hypothetical protein
MAYLACWLWGILLSLRLKTSILTTRWFWISAAECAPLIPPWKEVKNRQNREGVQILYWWTMHQKEISDLVDLLWVRFVIWSTTSACFPAFGCIHLFSATPHTAWKSVLGDRPKSYRTSDLSPTRAINCPVSFWGRPHAWYGCGHML